MAPESNSGDGLVLAETAGAAIESESHQGAGFWSPVSVTKRPDGTQGLYPHLAMDRAKPGLIAVNTAGRRFVNEAVSYHDFVEAMYRSHETTDTMPAWDHLESWLPSAIKDFMVAGREMTEKSVAAADLIIRPPLPATAFRFDQGHSFADSGRAEAEAQLGEIAALLKPAG